MQVFDPQDKVSIYYGLKRVFDWDHNLINNTIAEQVHCIALMRGSGIVGLTRNSRRWPMQSTLVSCSQVVRQWRSATAGRRLLPASGGRCCPTQGLRRRTVAGRRRRPLVAVRWLRRSTAGGRRWCPTAGQGECSTVGRVCHAIVVTVLGWRHAVHSWSETPTPRRASAAGPGQWRWVQTLEACRQGGA